MLKAILLKIYISGETVEKPKFGDFEVSNRLIFAIGKTGVNKNPKHPMRSSRITKNEKKLVSANM
jgi:hypothetical protein